ncbi:conserved hypothetical protein [Neospora caninum Liverpool]|uniref:Uncharacterized protein n=1 Tax=Neospora caninum (strain Liverpool) TaxID=572307 RepID=F0VNC5_NEOCL|nr:conserved hypothetical protein [Neospora caninum Liverpool]CBZ55221.1 conserved hypothetical protein [Neospora caninum Liverpool]CEL69948.1 TPA: hypothetical protein BN1204_056450 [Neospora caninum Liverpool]|eukprot:XP_003885249.1 conserved hypothetical protein [Neospora caninum Liverpool]
MSSAPPRDAVAVDGPNCGEQRGANCTTQASSPCSPRLSCASSTPSETLPSSRPEASSGFSGDASPRNGGGDACSASATSRRDEREEGKTESVKGCRKTGRRGRRRRPREEAGVGGDGGAQKSHKANNACAREAEKEEYPDRDELGETERQEEPGTPTGEGCAVDARGERETEDAPPPSLHGQPMHPAAMEEPCSSSSSQGEEREGSSSGVEVSPEGGKHSDASWFPDASTQHTPSTEEPGTLVDNRSYSSSSSSPSSVPTDFSASAIDVPVSRALPVSRGCDSLAPVAAGGSATTAEAGASGLHPSRLSSEMRRLLLEYKVQVSPLAASPRPAHRVSRLRSPPLWPSRREAAPDASRFRLSSFEAPAPVHVDLSLSADEMHACPSLAALDDSSSRAGPPVGVLDIDIARLLSRRLRITTRGPKKPSSLSLAPNSRCGTEPCSPLRGPAHDVYTAELSGQGLSSAEDAEKMERRFEELRGQSDGGDCRPSSFLAWGSARPTAALEVSGGELLRRGRKRKRAAALLDKLQILKCLNCGEVARGGYKFGDYVICRCCGENNFVVVREWSPSGEATSVGRPGDRGQVAGTGGADRGRCDTKREMNGMDSKDDDMGGKMLGSDDSSSEDEAPSAEMFQY